MGDRLLSLVCDPDTRRAYLAARAAGEFQQCRPASALARSEEALMLGSTSSLAEQLEYVADRYLMQVQLGADLAVLEAEILERIAFASRRKCWEGVAALSSVHGIILLRCGRVDEAIAAFRRHEVLCTGPDKHMFTVARAYVLAGRLDEAHQLAERTKRSRLERRRAVHLQSLLLTAEGRFEAADAAFRKASLQAGYPLDRANIAVRWMTVAYRLHPRGSWCEILPALALGSEVPFFATLAELGGAFADAAAGCGARARRVLARLRSRLDALIPLHGAALMAPHRAGAAWLGLKLGAGGARRWAASVLASMDELLALRCLGLQGDRDWLAHAMPSVRG
jgi:tetratricopeptide (TPR) repeat protein